MPRYYVHLVSPSHPVRDTQGVELSDLDAAHWHAMHLVYRLRSHAGDMAEDWVIEVGDEAGAVPLVVLPWAVPMMRHQAPAKPGCSAAVSTPPARPALRASVPGNPGRSPSATMPKLIRVKARIPNSFQMIRGRKSSAPREEAFDGDKVAVLADVRSRAAPA